MIYFQLYELNPNPFQKRFFLLVMFKWHFYIKFLQSVSQKLLEKCSCSLTFLDLEGNKKP